MEFYQDNYRFGLPKFISTEYETKKANISESGVNYKAFGLILPDQFNPISLTAENLGESLPI